MESDIEQIAPLFVDSVDTSLPDAPFSADPCYALDKIEAILSKRLFPPRSHQTYVLELHTGEIVAYGNVKPGGGPSGDADELDMFFVKVGLSGRGYGSQLMEAIQSDWAQRGLWVTVFEKNERARRFYEKCGFRLVDGAGACLSLGLEEPREERTCIMHWERTSKSC